MWNALQRGILSWFSSAQSYEGIAEKASQQASRN
jgi:hypothetical protein